MTKKLRWILLASIFLVIATLGWKSSFAQTSEQVYFPETGHWVSGEFLNAYQSVSDPLLLFGYPITEAFQEENTGLAVQYFQRARFELHPGAPAGQRVQFTPLGSELYEPGPEVNYPENFPACKVFLETGKQVCHAFLDFFAAHGGVAQFGYPISNFEVHDERFVQYFQRARFEWHPEYPPYQRVSLSNLGSRYFLKVGENPRRLMASQDDNLLQTILSLRVRAFPLSAVTGQDGKQTIYMLVVDQNRNPVANAAVKITVVFPSQEERDYTPLPTDENGITQYAFSFKDQPIGLVKIRVTATYNGLIQQTITSFRIWW